ncbi:hypothetical protein NW817_00190 [Synechococcus sp. H65.1]|uniref:hypothetical protein n=1 Tax=Synechococcus sp. H65.1 TaxID=2964525 RepID=UPI0039C1C2EB
MKEPAGAFRDSLLLGCFVWAVLSSAPDANWAGGIPALGLGVAVAAERQALTWCGFWGCSLGLAAVH